MMMTSDDEIRVHSQVEIPAGIRIECAATENGEHVLSFGGSVFGGPRLVLELQKGAAGQLLDTVRRALDPAPGAERNMPA